MLRRLPVQELAEDRLGNGYLGESHELITDALNTMLQVYGPLHSDIESSHKFVSSPLNILSLPLLITIYAVCSSPNTLD